MSPSHIHVPDHDDHDRQINASPPRLKISKVSHPPMKRSSPSATTSSSMSSPSSSAASSPSPPQSSICSPSATVGMAGPKSIPSVMRPPLARQQPVIIYTHSPKVIHTHPRDFMALVQKLTGLYRPDGGEDQVEPKSPTRSKPDGAVRDHGLNKNTIVKLNDGTKSSSVTTGEKISPCGHGSTDIVDHNRMQMMNPNPSFIPQISYEPPNNPYVNSFSMFDSTPSTDFIYANQPNFYTSYGDRLLFTPQDDDNQFHHMPLWR